MARDPQSEAGTPQYGHAVPRLLLIESDGGDRRSIHGALSAAQGILHVDHATTVAEGIAHLAERPVSAVLLDLTLSEARNLTAVDELRRAAPNVAIMILARAADQALARRAVERGANDMV